MPISSRTLALYDKVGQNEHVSIKGSSVEGRPTRRDVAQLAGVSGTTVSRILGGRPDESVSAKARDKVLEAARQLGYTPNSAAKALRSGRSGLVGFWMCLEYSLYRSRVLAEMRNVLADTQFALAVNDVDQDYAWHHSLDRALRVPAEGIIAFEPAGAGDGLAAMNVNLPFVSMGAFWFESRSYVAVDLQSGAEDAVEHLLQTGRTKIAHVVPKGTWFVVEGQRYDGYHRKMEEAGLPPWIIEIDDHPDRRIESLIDQLSVEPRPDALFCFYDDIAIDAVEALLQMNLTPGQEVAVVGCNGQAELARGPYPISTVRQPIEEMCRTAYQFLQNQMNDPAAPPEKVVLKPELVVRRTSERV